MPIFAVAVFFSAFLLFAVQPMIAKLILPSFGGTAAVWSTCLVFFQTLLLAGYAYAHLLRTKLTPKAQRWTHLGLLAFAMIFLPPVPTVQASAASAAMPVWELLRSLLTSVGIPFFALSATAPLLMEWFRQAFPNRTPDRLYALSNAGSLLALISYPIIIEPKLGGKLQALCWAVGMGLFLAVCGVTAWRSAKRATGATQPDAAQSKPRQANAGSAANGPMWLWVALAACGSGLLMALTNQISQDVAPMPLLWVAPLAVYLITFILCFESHRFYRRWLFLPACFISLLALAWLLEEGYLQGFWLQVSGYLTVVFCGCMVCHGELYGLRPPPERLTSYYLAISLGGALGGVFVALVAPIVFNALLETPLIAVAIASLSTMILYRQRSSKGSQPNTKRAGAGSNAVVTATQAALIGTLLIAAVHINAQFNLRKQSIHFARNFYGVYRVKEGPTLLLEGVDYPLVHGPVRVFLSGQIYHGLQFTSPEAQSFATSYYCEEGGLAAVLRELPATTNRTIGIVGLGAGAFAVHGREGDTIRFYELNPEVLRIANAYFTFLTNAVAKVEVVLGDGRLSLQNEPMQQFDLLLLDAFTGDSVPSHLLTDEAMVIYKRQMKPDGVIVFNISNLHLDLRPVLQALAEKHGFTAVAAPPKYVDPHQGKLPSVWMILSKNQVFLNRPAIQEMAQSPFSYEKLTPILWTDDHSSILPILH